MGEGVFSGTEGTEAGGEGWFGTSALDCAGGSAGGSLEGAGGGDGGALDGGGGGALEGAGVGELALITVSVSVRNLTPDKAVGGETYP